MTTFEQLPADIRKICLLQQLDMKTFLSFCQTNKQYHQLLARKDIWSKFLQKDFRVSEENYPHQLYRCFQKTDFYYHMIIRQQNFHICQVIAYLQPHFKLKEIVFDKTISGIRYQFRIGSIMAMRIYIYQNVTLEFRIDHGIWPTSDHTNIYISLQGISGDLLDYILKGILQLNASPVHFDLKSRFKMVESAFRPFIKFLSLTGKVVASDDKHIHYYWRDKNHGVLGFTTYI